MENWQIQIIIAGKKRGVGWLPFSITCRQWANKIKVNLLILLSGAINFVAEIPTCFFSQGFYQQGSWCQIQYRRC